MFVSNAVVSGNTNALRDTLDNYNAVKEFFKLENEAMIVAATMRYFGTDTVESSPTENKIPSNEEKRKWLHGHISSMLDEYVMDGVSDVERARDEMGHIGIRPLLPCRFSGRTWTFVYPKCRVNHEKKIHDLEVTEEKQDETSDETKKSELSESKDDKVFNYGVYT